MTLNIAGRVEESIVDGPGIRYVIFVQGCIHNCPGCHNKFTHRIGAGTTVSIQKLFEHIKKQPLIDGVTFSGGEPFLQAKPLAELARLINSIGLSIITYTGFTFEELIAQATEENGYLDLLSQTNILVDGKFIQELKYPRKPFVGSRNQRWLLCQESLKQCKAVEGDVYGTDSDK